MDVDLLDTRGRTIRLAIATGLGLVIAVLLFQMVESVAATPNPDPMSKLSGVVLGGGLFAASTAVIHAILTRVARRSRGSREPHGN